VGVDRLGVKRYSGAELKDERDTVRDSSVSAQCRMSTLTYEFAAVATTMSQEGEVSAAVGEGGSAQGGGGADTIITATVIDLGQWRSTTTSGGYHGIIKTLTSSGYRYSSYYHLDMFATAEEAAFAYAQEYLRHHGGTLPSGSSAEIDTAWIEAQPITDDDGVAPRFKRRRVEDDRQRGSTGAEGEAVGLQCNVCGRTFTNRGNLTAHMKMHANLTRRMDAHVRDKVRAAAAETQDGAAGESNEDTVIDLDQWRSDTSGGYHGVYKSQAKKSNERYKSQITIPGKGHAHLGTFDTAEEAALVHAREYLRIHKAPPESQHYDTNAAEDSIEDEDSGE